MRRSPVKSDRHGPGYSEERRLGGAQPVLRAAQLTRTVRGHTLVDHVSFTVYPRDLLAVLGPSGAGKSSLLRMLNRLDEPTAGTVYLHHRSYREIPPRDLRRRVGFVSQRSYLFPGTVGENLCFGPEQCGSTLQEEEVAALLEAVGLVGYGERNVATLSGGEVQRVAVARALANQPEVLLLDEPTSALDKAARAGVEWHIQRVIGEWGLACVMVTHDEEQARRMAGVALVLGEGRVEAMGPAMEVLGA